MNLVGPRHLWMHQVFEQQAVGVQVKCERSAHRQRLRQLGFVVHRGQVAPLIEDMNIGSITFRATPALVMATPKVMSANAPNP